MKLMLWFLSIVFAVVLGTTALHADNEVDESPTDQPAKSERKTIVVKNAISTQVGDSIQYSGESNGESVLVIVEIPSNSIIAPVTPTEERPPRADYDGGKAGM